MPAFIRVEPAMASGPVATAIRTSTPGGCAARGFAETSPVCAPIRLASASAPSTYGVRPEAARPSTKSPGRTDRAISAAPASASSSAFSTACRSAFSPPAWWATNQSLGTLNVGTSSAASSVARRPEVPAPT